MKMFSLLSKVFPLNIEESNHSYNDSIPRSLLFIGKEFSCKSSLIFQLNETLVNEYEDIHYILSQKKIKFPERIEGMEPIDIENGLNLQFLKVYYLSTYDSLINHFKAIESSADLSPIAIIIDNIDDYIKDWSDCSHIDRYNSGESKSQRMRRSGKKDKQLLAELSAILKSVGNTCRRRLNRNTLVVMGYDLKDASIKELPDIESIGRRFYDEVWTLQKSDKMDVDCYPVYTLDCLSNSAHLKLDMSLKEETVVLNKIAQKYL